MDDPGNVGLNAGLLVLLAFGLVALGQVLKLLRPVRSVPEWLPLLHAILGALVAWGLTGARTGGTVPPATAVEIGLALLGGALAGLASGPLYDALAMTLLARHAVIRQRRAIGPP